MKTVVSGNHIKVWKYHEKYMLCYFKAFNLSECLLWNESVSIQVIINVTWTGQFATQVSNGHLEKGNIIHSYKFHFVSSRGVKYSYSVIK